MKHQMNFCIKIRREAERELQVARKIFDDIPSPLRTEDLKYRIWNHSFLQPLSWSDEK